MSLESAAKDAGAGTSTPLTAASVARPPPTDEEVRERRERKVAMIAEHLRTEPRDGSWAPGYEASLREAVGLSAQGDAAPIIDSVSCRTSVCRLEVTSATSADQMKFVREFPSHRPPMVVAFGEMRPASDGTVKTVIDFVREGYPVPGAEESTD
jgi:hypothetical protein